MEVELVSPANEDSAYVPPLAIGILAAHTPEDVRVRCTDDLVTPIDLEREVAAPDLVGITVSSKTARRAYEIAAAYRRRGVPVVLGGIHATALPEEALEHADAVVVGEAEGLWEQVIADFRARRLRPLYRHEDWPSLAGLPFARREIFGTNHYVPCHPVQTTRGCPYPCEFCSVSSYNGGKFRFRPVREVVQEIESLSRAPGLRRKLVLFADDNVMVHERYSRDLLSALVPERIHWVGQASLAGLRKIENVELLARSGCKALFIGFESIRAETLRGAGKRQNDPARYRDTIDRLHRNGIAVWGSFLFGFDEDDEDVFARTVEFCIESRLTLALFAIITPYPGTALYGRLKAEGRLLRDRWWLEEEHELAQPFFRPARLSPDRLRRGWIEAWRSFYSYTSIWHRYRVDPGAGWVALLGHFPLNLFMRRLAEEKIAGGRRLFRRRPFGGPAAGGGSGPRRYG